MMRTTRTRSKLKWRHQQHPQGLLYVEIESRSSCNIYISATTMLSEECMWSWGTGVRKRYFEESHFASRNPRCWGVFLAFVFDGVSGRKILCVVITTCRTEEEVDMANVIFSCFGPSL